VSCRSPRLAGAGRGVARAADRGRLCAYRRRGQEREDGAPLPLTCQRPVPPPHRGDGRGLHGAAQWTDPRAQCDGADLERGRNADRARLPNTVGMYGEVRGIVGSRLPPGPAAQARRDTRPARKTEGRVLLIAHMARHIGRAREGPDPLRRLERTHSPGERDPPTTELGKQQGGTRTTQFQIVRFGELLEGHQTDRRSLQLMMNG
jgi:hypothetical protein